MNFDNLVAVLAVAAAGRTTAISSKLLLLSLLGVLVVLVVIGTQTGRVKRSNSWCPPQICWTWLCG